MVMGGSDQLPCHHKMVIGEITRSHQLVAKLRSLVLTSPPTSEWRPELANNLFEEVLESYKVSVSMLLRPCSCFAEASEVNCSKGSLAMEEGTMNAEDQPERMDIEDRPAQRSEVPKRAQKAPKADDVISTVTEDSFISFRKKFHFPNDLVMKVPARTDRACFPPPGYVTVYEFSLRAGLRFPPSSELIDILTLSGVCLSQFSYRAMSIVMGLIVLFRDRGVVLSSECLSRMGRLFSDAQGRISFRSKWLDIRTRDPSKGWISNFFYVQNDWGLQEKWGKLKELPVPLHIGAEDLLRILKLPDLDALHYEVRYLSRYVDEEYLFKIIIEDHIQEARSHIYDVEVKALEAECAEDGFIRGFMKGVRTVHRKTGAEIEGLTPSQASSDASSDSGGEELESEKEPLSTASTTTTLHLDGHQWRMSGKKKVSNGDIPREEQKSWTIVTPAPHFDGHQWRKYGEKHISNSEFPRRVTSLYHKNCSSSSYLSDVSE
ncbi:hypothetical protein IEQ34_013092 [Dendrobium chrysotoxum]|uniref:WRKY domain-containing protein n=1 Tax=Dendrobium chrysotoxum TaxID=161865 RepID=A0AAV7GP12_DENCH|nr:hypothetical protein IEQ34_013092 [Dendrobium chrysotoxum]